MTTIAWDGNMLAVDTRVTAGGRIFQAPTQKLRCIEPDVVLALAGPTSAFPLVAKWYLSESCGNGNPADSPAKTIADDEHWEAMAVHGRPSWFARVVGRSTHIPFSLGPGELYSLGSGSDFAFGAMVHGANALEAVRVAAKCDVYTGGPFDIATWDGERFLIERVL